MTKRKCVRCGHIENSEFKNPVSAMLGYQPCRGNEWLGHKFEQVRSSDKATGQES